MILLAFCTSESCGSQSSLTSSFYINKNELQWTGSLAVTERCFYSLTILKFRQILKLSSE